jgi:hypothetical protein
LQPGLADIASNFDLLNPTLNNHTDRCRELHIRKIPAALKWGVFSMRKHISGDNLPLNDFTERKYPFWWGEKKKKEETKS